MIGVGRTGEAIDAAMLAAAKRVDRPVEADVGRAVADQARFGVLDGDGSPASRNAVQRFHLVEPFALGDPLFQVEAGRGCVAGCAAPAIRLDGHAAKLRPTREHNKNINGSGWSFRSGSSASDARRSTSM